MTEEKKELNEVALIAGDENLTPAQRGLKIQLLLAQQVDGIYQDVELVKRKLDKVEREAPVKPYQNSELEKQRRRRVVKLLGGKEAPAYQDRQLAQRVFRAIMAEYRSKFGVARYQETSKDDYKRALAFYASWQPDYQLHTAIKEANEAEVEDD